MQRDYEYLPQDAKDNIDRAWSTLARDMRTDGYAVDTSDHAEHLIDALTAFFLVSNPTYRGFVREGKAMAARV